MKKLLKILPLCVSMFNLSSAGEKTIIVGGPLSAVPFCIPEEEVNRNLAISPTDSLLPVNAFPTIVPFSDPMGDGGMNSPGRQINNYVDLVVSGIQDYNCGDVTYDGHQGIDIHIRDFYEMDEGIPILCAAPGVVVARHDGEDDRSLGPPFGFANYMIVRHADNSRAWYYHMRKNSLQFVAGETVAVGDTLGYVGSSGFSTWPHIHFQVMDGSTVVEPFNGTCQTNSSWWISQNPYAWTYPFELLTHGLTTINTSVDLIAERPPSDIHVSDGELLTAWMTLRNFRTTDTLTWEFYDNFSNLWNTVNMVPAGDYRFSIWWFGYYLPSSSSYYGTWTVKILHNGVQIDQKNFTYDNQANQLPGIPTTVINLTSTAPYQGEFSGTDPDGSIFWYEISSGPTKGTLSQSGGRKRKFTYLPSTSIPGPDTVVLYAVDEDSAIGPNGYYIFDLQCLAKPGDVNGTVPISLPDVIQLVNYVFDQDRPATSCLGSDPGNCWTPDPLCRGEVNGTAPISLPDVIHLVNYVFDKDRPATSCLGSSPGNCWLPVATGVCCLP